MCDNGNQILKKNTEDHNCIGKYKLFIRVIGHNYKLL